MTVLVADKQLVEALPLFSGIEPGALDRILPFAALQRYPSRTTLFCEGERPDKLYIVLSGTVEIYSTTSGREWGVMLMNSGDVFMPGAVLFDEPYTTSARTLGFCRLALIDAERVRSEASSCASLALHLSRAMAGQFRVALRQVLDLKARSAAQRLGSFLLKIVDSSSAPAPALPMPKRNLAARIGMTPETLSRTLQILADNGLLVRGRQILVRDRARIEQFCGPEPYRPAAEDLLQVHAL